MIRNVVSCSTLTFLLILSIMGCQKSVPDVEKEQENGKENQVRTVTDPEVLKKLEKMATTGPTGRTFRPDKSYPGGMMFSMPPEEALPLLKDVHNLTTLYVLANTKEKLAHIEPLAMLRFLYVQFGHQSTGAKTVEPMSDAEFVFLKNLGRLVILRIRDGRVVTGEGFKYLAALPNLEELACANMLLNDTALQELQRCPKLKKLTFALGSPVTSAGIGALGQIMTLEHVNVRAGGKILPPAFAELTKARPGLKIDSPKD